jgi:hypothetical protein
VRCFATPNRCLLDRIVIFDFVRPFDLIPKYKNLAYGKNLVFRFAQNKEICEASRAEGEASEQTNSPRNDESCIWSQLLNAVRTFFEQNSD